MTPVQQKRRAAIAQRTPDPYDKWLNEDVVYIIRPEERAAFERLASDAEKEHFIEQFWEVRGSAAKAEHYRRIAYANDNFAEGNTPGWKTDRGRAYIIDGPSIQVPAPDVQANGDSLYEGKRASVRVGTQGATLIKVDGSDVQVTLDRITGSDGSGEVVLHESARSGEEEYIKLLALPPGAYRLVAEMSGPSSSDRERRRQLQRQLGDMQAQFAAAQQMYTDRHPQVLKLQKQSQVLEDLSEMLWERAKAKSRTQMEFHVP
jgi:GWxTD domain-containing protein